MFSSDSVGTYFSMLTNSGGDSILLSSFSNSYILQNLILGKSTKPDGATGNEDLQVEGDSFMKGGLTAGSVITDGGVNLDSHSHTYSEVSDFQTGVDANSTLTALNAAFASGSSDSYMIPVGGSFSLLDPRVCEYKAKTIGGVLFLNFYAKFTISSGPVTSITFKPGGAFDTAFGASGTMIAGRAFYLNGAVAPAVVSAGVLFRDTTAAGAFQISIYPLDGSANFVNNEEITLRFSAFG